MQNVLTETISLKSRDCDFTGRWKPSEIFMAMQELAAAHSAVLGAGYSYMRARSLAFALTRTELHMEKYPKIGDKVVCHTWAAPVMKWMYPRYFIFESESGERLGYAGTIWVLLDLAERKMVAPAALGTEIATGDLTAPMRMPGKAAPVSAEAEAHEYLPGYSEIDVNHHVNNTRYVSWLGDRLGTDVMEKNCIKSLTVNYNREILPGETVALRIEREDCAFRMSGDIEGANRFALSGELTPCTE